VRRLVSRRLDERGVAPSSPLALLSVAAVVLAGAAFVVTNGQQDDTAEASSTTTASAAPVPTKTAHQQVIKKHVRKKPVVHRGATYVEVFNNSGISGLAGSTAARAQGAGWNVVGSDNWYGTIDASTIYYPPRLRAAAKLLGKDLGIAHLKPSIPPMRGDRLTVILTADYT
jgi:LytR cell envelope-related transcriptional attenuator